MRSATKYSRCSATITVLPRARMAAIWSCSTRIARASRFAVGSSSTYTSGSITSTEANTRLCFSPPDIFVTPRSSRCSTCSAPTVARMRSSIASASTPAASRPNASSSLEVRLKNCDFGFWNTLPTCRASSCMAQRAGSKPHTSTSPVRSTPGSNCGMRPLISFVTVVFPMPERPHSSTHSPRRTVRSTPSRMSASPAPRQDASRRRTTTGASSPRAAARPPPRASAHCRAAAISTPLPTAPRPRPPPRTPRAPPNRRRACAAARCR